MELVATGFILVTVLSLLVITWHTMSLATRVLHTPIPFVPWLNVGSGRVGRQGYVLTAALASTKEVLAPTRDPSFDR